MRFGQRIEQCQPVLVRRHHRDHRGRHHGIAGCRQIQLGPQIVGRSVPDQPAVQQRHEFPYPAELGRHEDAERVDAAHQPDIAGGDDVLQTVERADAEKKRFGTPAQRFQLVQALDRADLEAHDFAQRGLDLRHGAQAALEGDETLAGLTLRILAESGRGGATGRRGRNRHSAVLYDLLKTGRRDPETQRRARIVAEAIRYIL